jgi:hypothetical protein
MVRCLVQGLKLDLQSFQIEKESDQDIKDVRWEVLLEETLLATLVSASASIARAVEVSPSAADDAAWIASRQNSKRPTSRVASE